MLYDLFICHASEDKKNFVRPLAKALKQEHVEVWYDEFSLKLGDSIRRSINLGLSQARFGVVILSPAFFSKKWTQYELDGLTEREMSGNDKIILPIWHDISHDTIMSFSPSLAGRKAVLSSVGIKKVTREILEVIHPQGSPLIEARDHLVKWGLNPPVITDKFWLEVVEASNRSPAYGAIIPEESIWDRWSFPLPEKNDNAKDWGERLSWTAMQLNWIKSAVEIPITPLTHPNLVLDFISGHPGLSETCELFVDLTAEYAPQLTIPGMGGVLEYYFEKAYQDSVTKCERQKVQSPEYGTDLTVDKTSPLCDEEWSLRHDTFANYKPLYVANAYFHGGMFGPNVSPYEEFDHLVWLLALESNWLPRQIHTCLLEGMIHSHSWPWGRKDGDWPSNGKFGEALYDTTKGKKFKMTKDASDDLLNRIKKTVGELKLKQKPETLYDKFIDNSVADAWIKREKRQKSEMKKR